MKYGSPPIKLIEECGELIQAVCKGERFGYDDRNPLIENSPTCRQRVLDEIDDVENALKNFKSWLNGLPEDIKREDKIESIEYSLGRKRGLERDDRKN
jgi:NTP pyrophosphatase (non-canonical NTP hydrolase)